MYQIYIFCSFVPSKASHQLEDSKKDKKIKQKNKKKHMWEVC